MAVVASLDIVMRAQTDQATGKLLKASNVLGQLKNALIGAAGAWLSFNGAVRAFTNTLAGLNRLDDLAEKASSLGIGVNELRAMGNAAELAGSNTDSLVQSISIMQKAIGNAAASGGSAVFDRLGVSVAELQELDAAQQFITLAEAIQKLPNQTDRAAASAAVFGKGYLSLANLMEDARSQIGDAADFIDRFNGNMSELDVAKVSVAQDAWDQLRQAISLAWESLSKQFAPELAALAGALTRLVEMFLGFGAVVKVVFSSNVGKVIAFTTAIMGLYAAISLLVPAVIALGRAFSFLAGSQSLVMVLTNPANWLLIAEAVGAAAVVFKMMEAEFDAMEAKVNELVDKPKQLKFKAIGLIPDLEEALQDKVVTIRTQVNPPGDLRGSQEDLARRLRVEVETTKTVDQQQLREQQNGNQVLNKILEELKNQADDNQDANL